MGTPRKVIAIPDSNESWAEVELFRWQYGELPRSDDTRKLDIAAGLKGMASAIEKGCKEKTPNAMPSPFNVCSVLNYAAGRQSGNSATWQRCSEGFPDDDATVLVALDDGEVEPGFRDAGLWRYVSGDRIETEVTHWMEFPEPPK